MSASHQNAQIKCTDPRRALCDASKTRYFFCFLYRLTSPYSSVQSNLASQPTHRGNNSAPHRGYNVLLHIPRCGPLHDVLLPLTGLKGFARRRSNCSRLSELHLQDIPELSPDTPRWQLAQDQRTYSAKNVKNNSHRSDHCV